MTCISNVSYILILLILMICQDYPILLIYWYFSCTDETDLLISLIYSSYLFEDILTLLNQGSY